MVRNLAAATKKNENAPRRFPARFVFLQFHAYFLRDGLGFVVGRPTNYRIMLEFSG